jgi:hypothetical protein
MSDTTEFLYDAKRALKDLADLYESGEIDGVPFGDEYNRNALSALGDIIVDVTRAIERVQDFESYQSRCVLTDEGKKTVDGNDYYISRIETPEGVSLQVVVSAAQVEATQEVAFGTMPSIIRDQAVRDTLTTHFYRKDRGSLPPQPPPCPDRGERE